MKEESEESREFRLRVENLQRAYMQAIKARNHRLARMIMDSLRWQWNAWRE